MIIHLPPRYKTPRLARRKMVDASDRPEFSCRAVGTFIVDNHGYHPKRGKLDRVRKVPPELAEKILQLEHKQALAMALLRETLQEAYDKGEPVRPYRVDI